jgi:tetratricopeptide (TPR) repeat protein
MSVPIRQIPRPGAPVVSRRLNSWKEIANYLSREVRTVQRWEKSSGLPVRRLNHEQRGSVYAFTAELDAWMESRQPATAISVASDASRKRLPGLAAVAIFLVAVVAGIVAPGMEKLFRGADNQRSALTELSPAREAYLRGIYLLDLQTLEGLTKSISEFQKAIELDPRFAPAYARIAEAHTYLSFGKDRSAQSAVARDWAQRALRTGSSSAEAHEAQAMIDAYVDWNWMAAQREYQTALRLAPDLATAHSNYAQLEAILGRQDVAVAEAQHAWQLQPLSPTLGASLGWFYYWAHRFDEAIVTSRQVLKSQPAFASAQACIVRSLVAQGKFAGARDELIAQMRLARSDYRSAGLDAVAPQQAIRNFYAWKLGKLKEQQKAGHFPSFDLALTLAALGHTDELMSCLEESFQQHQFIVLLINVEPFFDPYRQDPRLVQLAKKIGLAPQQTAKNRMSVDFFSAPQQGPR